MTEDGEGAAFHRPALGLLPGTVGAAASQKHSGEAHGEIGFIVFRPEIVDRNDAVSVGLQGPEIDAKLSRLPEPLAVTLDLERRYDEGRAIDQ